VLVFSAYNLRPNSRSSWRNARNLLALSLLGLAHRDRRQKGTRLIPSQPAMTGM
jgi:hypothetical protein